MISKSRLERQLADRFGLEFGVELLRSPDDTKVVLWPLEVEPAQGFRFHFVIGWRSIVGRFELGPYARALLESMNRNCHYSWNVARVFAESIARNGGRLLVRVNDRGVESEDCRAWPEAWNSYVVELEAIGDFDAEAVIFSWIDRFVGYCLACVPLEANEKNVETDSSASISGPEGVSEGRSSYIVAKKYERSLKNRAACIELFGCRCAVCRLEFGRQYGEIGEGFIHVHHVVPLSEMGEGYVVDPATDLVPVCPNCHAMMHRRNPPLSPQELRNILEASE